MVRFTYGEEFTRSFSETPLWSKSRFDGVRTEINDGRDDAASHGVRRGGQCGGRGWRGGGGGEAGDGDGQPRDGHAARDGLRVGEPGRRRGAGGKRWG